MVGDKVKEWTGPDRGTSFKCNRKHLEGFSSAEVRRALIYKFENLNSSRCTQDGTAKGGKAGKWLPYGGRRTEISEEAEREVAGELHVGVKTMEDSSIRACSV